MVTAADSIAFASINSGEFVFVGKAAMFMTWKLWTIIRGKDYEN